MFTPEIDLETQQRMAQPSLIPRTHTPLRPYQQRAFEFATARERKNSIVMLPTGAGKTLVAAAVIIHVFKRVCRPVFPANPQRIDQCYIAFIVPTLVLVSQQADVLKKETGLRVREYRGGVDPPVVGDFDIVVATPAAFKDWTSSDSEMGFNLQRFALIVFDEVHHVIKRHPYRTIALKIKDLETRHPIVLGLSASLTYASDPARMRATIQSLCENLSILQTDIFMCTVDELRSGGYHAAEIEPDVRIDHEDIDLGDDENIQRLKLKMVMESDVKEFLQIVKGSKYPHVQAHPLTVALVNTIENLEMNLQATTGFEPQTTSDNKLGEWGEKAKEAADKGDRDHSGYFMILMHLYEAFRIIANSQQSGLELGMQYLVMANIFGNPSISELPSMKELSSLWSEYGNKLTRLTHLVEVLCEQLDARGDTLSCIIFVQQRVVAHIICHYLALHRTLQRLSPTIFYSVSKRATPTLTMNKSEVNANLERFRYGLAKVLVATNAVEEGMDVPGANCVIRFDPIQSLVSFVQGRGRARQENSAFVVLRQSEKLSVDRLKHAESQQSAIITGSTFGQDFSQSDPSNEANRQRQLRDSQRVRVRDANQILLAHLRSSPRSSAFAALQQYVNKIRGEIIDAYVGIGLSWKCTLEVIDSDTRSLGLPTYGKLKMESVSAAKKDAKEAAAAEMIQEIVKAMNYS